MRSVFVTGTDTGVGKTVVTGLFARYLRLQRLQAVTQKWVQTGTRDYPCDLPLHLELMGADAQMIRGYEHDVNPYTFAQAASPHLAAAHENTRIDTQKIVTSFRRLEAAFDSVIVEGAGGVLVPLNEKELFIDVAADLDLPILVVAANKLGAINHTLLTIEALKTRDIDILGIVFNTVDPDQNEAVMKDNPEIVAAFARVPVLGRLPWSNETERLYRSFEPIAENVTARLTRT